MSEIFFSRVGEFTFLDQPRVTSSPNQAPVAVRSRSGYYSPGIGLTFLDYSGRQRGYSLLTGACTYISLPRIGFCLVEVANVCIYGKLLFDRVELKRYASHGSSLRIQGIDRSKDSPA